MIQTFVAVCSLSSGDRKVRVAAPEEKMDLPQRCRSDALCLPLIQPPPPFLFLRTSLDPLLCIKPEVEKKP